MVGHFMKVMSINDFKWLITLILCLNKLNKYVGGSTTSAEMQDSKTNTLNIEKVITLHSILYGCLL